ncbi:MAG: metalloregulator ArsR/SmtB family transcription factor [Hyphomonadaceae bacterium]|jgi:DNA-binding transcriptional ArsR family regulator|nr:metalloregulator ArsR/SmtB family transcription factor [Hyphomonadaceae bacterium]
MDNLAALDALSSLSQASRLDAFKLLVRHTPKGLPAGDVARLLDVPQNTMSTHLGILQRAGLVKAEREGRSVIYHADLDRLRALMLFLVKDCCGASADLTRPLVAELSLCC